ncbi:DEKNAAC103072 [Brettanomyces naardenensis]|uniref:MMS19 nucleotide excision repair protein n=1 Tax=Brettanomyces naardenensis TaxID=13370 RepID=A0A448YMG7_BRENA|nr:DEKNAAC103072 [Brettanomyces naardenensis]
MDNFQPELIETLLDDIKSNYSPTDQLASTRYSSFDILQHLLLRFESYLVDHLNDKFIDTFIHISSNEKDPKNLMESFTLNKAISTKFDISSKEDDLFDCVFCYFPISFRAPANNPYNITGDQLKQALRDCLSCNALYAKDSFPNLVEKLTSTSPSVKMDVLLTIKQCIEQYPSDTIEEYFISLWNSLKYEILHRELASADNINDMLKYYENAENEDEQTVAVTLHIFECFSKKFSDVKQERYADYLILVYDSLKEYLGDPESAKIRQSSVIMSVFCGSNLNSYNLLISKCLTSLLTPLKKKQPSDLTIRDQRSMLTNVSFMLDSYHELFNEKGLAVDPSNNQLFNFKDDILTLINRALLSASTVEVTFRCLAIKLIVKLFSLASFLEIEECQLIVQTLTDVLLEDENAHTFSQALAALSEISKEYPMIILEFTVPRLMVLLPDSSTTVTSKVFFKEKVLDVLLTISDNRLIINSVLIRLLNKLEIVLQNENTGYYPKLLLFSLSKLLRTLSPTDSTNDYLKKFIPRFLHLVITEIVIKKSSAIYEDPIAAEYSARVLKEIVAKCDPSLHQKLLDDVFELFVGESTTNSLLYKPLEKPVNISRNTVLFILFAGICSTIDYKAAKVPMDSQEFVNSIIAVLDSGKLELAERQAALQAVSLVVNKWFGSEQRPYLLKKLASMKGSEVNAGSLEIFTFVTKALLLKNDRQSKQFVDYLIGLLENGTEEIARLIPKCFEIIVAEADCFELYRRPGGAFGKWVVFNVNVRPFYKQKFVDSTLPLLIEKFRANVGSRNHLLAIALIVKYSEREIIVPHLEKILPVVLTALMQRSSLILSSSLTILEIAIEETPELIKGHLSTLVPRLLEVLRLKGSTETKIKTLECLMALSRFPLHLVVPFKEDIIDGCVVSLDDDKRGVRRLGCDVSQVYYELGSEE